MTKKYSTLRAKLREQIKAEGKLTRTYKRREPGEVKETTHVTRESLIARHTNCITVDYIKREKARALKLGLRYDLKDDDIKGVCNHPNDGVCGTDFTDEQVKEVNARLSGAAEEPNQDLENSDTKSKPRRRRGKAEKPPAKYFCTKCETWHADEKISNDRYVTHMKFKRGRGRPPKI